MSFKIFWLFLWYRNKDTQIFLNMIQFLSLGKKLRNLIRDYSNVVCVALTQLPIFFKAFKIKMLKTFVEIMNIFKLFYS